MTTPIDWPEGLSHGIVRFEPYGGGRGLGGAVASPAARGAGTYGPLLRAKQANLPVLTRQALLAARALQAELASGATPIMLPACVGGLTPQLSGAGTLEAALGADAEAGADTITILLANDRGLRGGEWFSADHDNADVGRRAYMVAELVDNSDPAAPVVRIVPRLRADLDEEAVLDFLTPTAPFRLVDGFELPTELGRFSGIEAVYEEWFDVSPVAQTALLRPLTLSPSTIEEGSAEDTFVGRLFGATAGSTLTLTDDAGGRFKYFDDSGVPKIVAGATATDFDSATSHNITVRETLIGRANSPRDTVLTVNVTEIVSGEVVLATYYINIIGTSLQHAGALNERIFDGFGAGNTVRVSKPLVADDGNMLYDAFSAWPNDNPIFFPPPIPNRTWQNYFTLWGLHVGDVSWTLLFTLEPDPAPKSLTAYDAWLYAQTQLPVEFTGWDNYRILGDDDNNPSDNRGGLSLKVEKVAP